MKMKNAMGYRSFGSPLVFSESTLKDLRANYCTSEVETEDGWIFTPNRLAYPGRRGKLRNLAKVSKLDEEIWSIEPRIPEVPSDQYDYFTFVRVHDESLNLVEAYTSSGYKLLVDASTGEIREVIRDHIFRKLEVKSGVVIKEDGTPLDLGGKKVYPQAYEVDDGIIVVALDDSYPEYEESKRLVQEIREAEKAGLPEPPAKPGFPGCIANLWKVKPDGTLILSVAPPPFKYPYINFYSGLGFTGKTDEVSSIHKVGLRPNRYSILDVRDLRVIEDQEGSWY